VSKTRKRSAEQRERGTPQGVDKPILCSPYVEPDKHWIYDQFGLPEILPYRRRAGYYWRDPARQRGQLAMLEDENFVELTHIQKLRDYVREWREKGYPRATHTTRTLLRHWSDSGRERKLFFCQLEAAETIIWLMEAATPKQREEVLQDEGGGDRTLDEPVDAESVAKGYQPLRRYCCKKATGAGKTVVMAMLAAWSVLNKLQNPRSEKHSDAILVVCPNLTIKKRLEVLLPNHPGNYYGEFDLIPSGDMRKLMEQAAIHITNWHAFAEESPHAEGGRSYVVVNKGPESDAAFCEREEVLGRVRGKRKILVFNDEAHHAYRPLPLDEDRLKAETAEERAREKQEREEATVWISGLDRINAGVGILACVDLTATPFYISGSGHPEGTPLPWIVSDFGLVDAIEVGIVKVPRVPVVDATGRPEPRYFRLWEHIMHGLEDGEGRRTKRKKPEAIAREADDALKQLAGLWSATFEEYQKEGAVIPPVMIVVCDNTDLSEYMFQLISGERVEDDPERPRKKRVVFGRGHVFPECLQNDEQQPPNDRPSMRIDTKLLNEAEGQVEGATRADVAEVLRQRVNTVGKPGQPGQNVRCVVSVGMLTEGWDACNVTHILGLRAFTTQLLCEQVVGRGLRRTDYTVDPETGLLEEQYVDVYGIPFEVIPFKKRPVSKPPPPPKPTTWVRALDEREHLQLRFPRVEGIICDVTEGITVDWDEVEPLEIDQSAAPTETISRPRVGYQYGSPGIAGPGEPVKQTRQQFYDSVRLQEIEYELASRVTAALADANTGKLKLSSRHLLFPHVLGIVRKFRQTRVNYHGVNPKEIGVLRYVEMITQRLVTAIRPLDRSGEVRLIPRLERYRPIGSTEEVDFHTSRPCRTTERSHVSHVVLDTATWEASAAFHLEASPLVASYVRNDHLDFVIPYEFLGQPRVYVPDFLVKLTNGITLVLEVKGYEDEEDREKHTAAHRWVDAVNNWGELGRWEFGVCREPGEVRRLLTALSGYVR